MSTVMSLATLFESIMEEELYNARTKWDTNYSRDLKKNRTLYWHALQRKCQACVERTCKVQLLHTSASHPWRNTSFWDLVHQSVEFMSRIPLFLEYYAVD